MMELVYIFVAYLLIGFAGLLADIWERGWKFKVFFTWILWPFFLAALILYFILGLVITVLNCIFFILGFIIQPMMKEDNG